MLCQIFIVFSSSGCENYVLKSIGYQVQMKRKLQIERATDATIIY